MGKINSRNKGASFEREVAKHLNTLFEKEDIDSEVLENMLDSIFKKTTYH